MSDTSRSPYNRRRGSQDDLATHGAKTGDKTLELQPAGHGGVKPALGPQMVFDGETAHPFTIDYLPVSQLDVDMTYQRGLKDERVRAFAQDWNAHMAGTLLVNRRADGTVVVVDGQHRWRAAQLAQHTHVLCQITAGLTVPEEARLFTHLNQDRTPPKIGERFKASLMTGDDVTRGIQAIVHEHGFAVNLTNRSTTVPRMISAIQALRQIYSGGGVRTSRRMLSDTGATYPDRLRAVLSTVATVWPDEQTALSGEILVALDIFLTRYEGQLDQERLHQTLADVVPVALLRRGKQRRHDNSGGSAVEQHIAQEILVLYNKRSRYSKLAA